MKKTPLSSFQKFKNSMKRAGYDMDAGAKRLQDLLDKQKKEREEREMNSTKSEEASPMIKPPKNEFGKKEDAFAHAKQHGGKVMKKTFIHPTSGMKTVSYVVKEETEIDEASKKPNATTRHLRQYPVSDRDVAKPVTYYSLVHKATNKVLSTHKDLESAKDEHRGMDQGERAHYRIATSTKAPKSFSMKEDAEGVAEGIMKSLATRLVKGAANRQTPQEIANTHVRALNQRAPGTRMQGHPNFADFKREIHSYISAAQNGEQAFARTTDDHVKSLFKKYFSEDVAEAAFKDPSPMMKDSIKQDKIRSLKNLISIAKVKGVHHKVKEYELELKKLKETTEVSEAGPFSYGAKPLRKGSVAYNALMKRKEQDKKRVKEIEAIGTKNHHVGVARVVTKEDIEHVTEAKDAEQYSYIDQSGGHQIKGKSGTYVGYTHSTSKGKGANILKHNKTGKYYAAGGSSTAFTQKTTLHDTPQAAAKSYHKGNLAESKETPEHHFEKSLEHYQKASEALGRGDTDKHGFHATMGDMHREKVSQHIDKARKKGEPVSHIHAMWSHLTDQHFKHKENKRNKEWEDEKNQTIQRGREYMDRAGERSDFEMKDGKLHARFKPKYDSKTGKKLKENYITEEERKSEFNDPHRNTIMYHAEHVHKNLHHAETLKKAGDSEGAKMHLSTAMMHMDQLNKRVGEHGKNHFGHFIERAYKASESIHGYGHKITNGLRKQKEDYLKESLNYGKSFKDLREAAYNSNCCPDEEYGFTEEEFTVTGTEQYEDWGDDIVEGKLSFTRLSQKLHEEDGKNVKLNKPFLTPGGPKKRAVYVKNDKGNTVKVNFGDPNLEIKRDDPERKSSFRARHNCDNPGPKWKARYWSCKFWSSTPVSKL